MILAPGFRFHPTDVELLKYYLKRKVLGRKFHFEAISEIDIYKHAPWDLPDKACLPSADRKWYFFCPKAKKYASGGRLKRATEFGYWKTTGKDRPVHYNGEVVGMIKTLVFHAGRAPKGDRTDWVMHEYRLEDKNLADRGLVRDSYVICMLFKKEGPGPRNGAQYGAPFREEDWADDDEDDRALAGPSKMSQQRQNNFLPMGDDATSTSCTLESMGHVFSPESCVSDMVTPGSEVTLPSAFLPMGDNATSTSHTLESMGHVFSPESCVSDLEPPSSEVALPSAGNGIPVDKVESSNDDDDIMALLDCL